MAIDFIQHLGFGRTIRVAGISEKVSATMKIRMYNADSAVCIIHRGKIARKFCGTACRPRVENYFDLERTRRVICLFGINFMLVPTKSSGGVSDHGLCLLRFKCVCRIEQFRHRAQF